MNAPVYACPDCGLIPDPPWTKQDHCGSEWYCGLRQQYHQAQDELGWPRTEYRLGPGHYVRQVMKTDRLAIEAEHRRRTQHH
jgi:hypothetical protein